MAGVLDGEAPRDAPSPLMLPAIDVPGSVLPLPAVDDRPSRPSDSMVSVRVTGHDGEQSDVMRQSIRGMVAQIAKLCNQVVEEHERQVASLGASSHPKDVVEASEKSASSAFSKHLAFQREDVVEASEKSTSSVLSKQITEGYLSPSRRQSPPTDGLQVPGFGSVLTDGHEAKKESVFSLPEDVPLHRGMGRAETPGRMSESYNLMQGPACSFLPTGSTPAPRRPYFGVMSSQSTAGQDCLAAADTDTHLEVAVKKTRTSSRRHGWPPPVNQFQVTPKAYRRRNSQGSAQVPTGTMFSIGVAQVGGQWSTRRMMTHHLRQRFNSFSAFTGVLTSKVSASDRRAVRWLRAFASHFPLHPTSTGRSLLDLLFLAMMFYDSLAIPCIMAWQVELTGWVGILYIISTGFWSFDLLMGFASGYFPMGSSGEAVMEWGKIAKHYLCTWFVPDICLVLIDWAIIFIDARQSSYTLRVLRMARLSRTLRVFQVLSMGRLDTMWQNLSMVVDTSQWTDVIQVIFVLCKQCFCVIWLNHIGACMHYGVGEWSYSRTGSSWLLEETRGWSSINRYLVGFIWSTSTMLGDRPDPATNTVEWLLEAFWLVLGLFATSVIVSNLTEMMWQLTERRKEFTSKQRSLRSFLSQQKVDRGLAFTIIREVSARLSLQRRLTDQDVPVLAMMSSGLRMQLRCDRVELALNRHPVLRAFEGILGNRQRLLRGLCKKAVDYVFYKPGEQVFRVEEKARQVYTVAYGRLHYMTPSFHEGVDSMGIHSSHKDFEVVEANRWVSHQALWLEWEHVGNLEVSDQAELITIGIADFIQSIAWHNDLTVLAHGYAMSLQAHYKELEGSPISDLHDHVSHPVIVLGMSSELRFKMAKPALEELKKSGLRWSSALRNSSALSEDLETEVRLGKCSLAYRENGHILRLVAMSALRLYKHEDGEPRKFLIQVGKCSAKKPVIQPQFLLPGKKAGKDETPKDALQRVLQDVLFPIKDHVEEDMLNPRDISFEERDSSSFQGLSTVYAKTIFRATIEPSLLTSVVKWLSRGGPKRATIRNVGDLGTLRRAWSKAANGSPARFESVILSTPPDLFMWEPSSLEEVEETQVVFAWVTEQQFEDLTNPRNMVLVQEWLADFDTGFGDAGRKTSMATSTATEPVAKARTEPAAPSHQGPPLLVGVVPP